MHSLAIFALFLATIDGGQATIYTKNSPVLQVDAKSWDKLIARTNHTSIVEFYAPWCGHCQNLKGAYEKAARSLDGLAKVAAIDCDDDANKAFCGSMGVQGFPTIKIVRPNKKPGGRPLIEDYKGGRTASAMVEGVLENINNHVKRLTDKELDAFLSQDGPKAILFSEKGKTSALLRSIAIDFLGVISFAQIRRKELESAERFQIETFPTLILIPDAPGQAIHYDGEMKKQNLVAFLSQSGSPNPDCTIQLDGVKSQKLDTKSPASTPDTAQAETTREGGQEETDSPAQKIPTTYAESIQTIDVHGKLADECLVNKASACIVLFHSGTTSDTSDATLQAFHNVARKHAQAKRHTFRFILVPATNEDSTQLLRSLKLVSGPEVIAINSKRGWWSRYEDNTLGLALESWVESIRTGEAVKSSLPPMIVGQKPVAPTDDDAQHKLAEEVHGNSGDVHDEL